MSYYLQYTNQPTSKKNTDNITTTKSLQKMRRKKKPTTLYVTEYATCLKRVLCNWQHVLISSATSFFNLKL
jgi:hypothetical protein